MGYKRYERYKDSGVEWIGEMPEGWEIVKLKYITEIIMGQSPNSDGYNIEGKGIPFLQGNADFSSLFPIPESYCTNASKLSIENDILLSVRAPVGALNISDKKYAIGRGLCAIRPLKVNMKYLWYLMNISAEALHVEAKGSTFESVTVRDVSNIYCQITSNKTEQYAIVGFLDQKTAEIDSLIADKKKMVQLLQEMRQAIISEAVTKGLDKNVKMKDSGVDWIGEIPEGWEASKVKLYYDICLGKMIQSSPVSASDTLEYYLCTANVSWDGIDVSNIKEMWFSDYEKTRYAINEGDLVVCEGGDAGRAAIWNGQLNKCYIQNAVHRVRGKNGNINKYLYYWLYFLKHIDYINLICNRATITHYTCEKFMDTLFLNPNISEQKILTMFLDQKTAEIDSLIADKKKMVQLLQEMRQAIISEAVTKGLDKNVKMKDSGVEWIGEIPEGWEIIPLKWFISIKSGEFLSKTNMDEDAIIPVIGGNGVMTYTSNSNIKKDTLAIGRVGALCGNVHLIDFVAWITDNALYLNEINNRVYVNYLFYCFEVMNLNRLANRTAQPLITGNVVKNQQIPYPSINVQRSIANFLDQKTTEIDHLIADGEKTIAKLQEYRQSLISEAVTGKIDVRDFIGSTEGGMQDGCNAG